MRIYIILALLLLLNSNSARAAELFIEAENFSHKGGWVVDNQYMDLMGSSYLMAHGLGKPVEKAFTQVQIPEAGKYRLYVRTYNWTSPWYDGEGPGKFNLRINDSQPLGSLGTQGKEWAWQYAGEMELPVGEVTLSLEDLTGFNGRCDALYFTTDLQGEPSEQAKLIPNRDPELRVFRNKLLGLPEVPPEAGAFDLVVTGGGVAGISAAVSAARLGLKVALVQNRPILGGNNSSDVRVHLGGRIETGPYGNLGDLQKEFGPARGGNARPAEYYEDQKKLDFVLAEPNITLFLNHHVYGVVKDGKSRIEKVLARHTETGQEIALAAPLFADCTGDGSVGVLAGANYRMGREPRSEHGEPQAPEIADKMTLGASVQWYSVDTGKESSFPKFKYGIDFNAQNAEKVTMGEWTWETGLNKDQIREAEQIRDYGMLVVFSNWSWLKNESGLEKYKNLALDWVAYIAGKRESRRLLGDHILTENDILDFVIYPDAAGSTTWSIDLHYPDPKNTKYFPNKEFKAIAVQNNIYPYPVPYRCLYSRNVENLFMAGRNISVTHIALGTTRVMRTCGIMGEVVGMAASLCKKYNVGPRGIYQAHLQELKELMELGVGRGDLPNNQTYNLGGTLGTHPSLKE